jgi:dihydrofolate reductase
MSLSQRVSLTDMARLTAYTFTTLNGFYKGPGDDISWHTHGDEEAQYSVDSLAEQGTLLFGRKTYEQMANFWPTPMAAEQYPEVAKGMNRADKIVFSRTPFTPEWEGTRCISGDIVAEVRKLKETADKDMIILGSGSIVSLFADNGLIDGHQIMIDPVAIGQGTPLFDSITHTLRFRLTDSRVFSSGTVLLSLAPEP